VCGGVDGGAPGWTAKVNAHFGAPSGVTALFSAADGALLALMDSAYLTRMRTAAVTVVAIRALAPASAARACLVGAGRQGRMQAQALRLALPELASLAVFDADGDAARRLAEQAGGEAVDALAPALARADVVVTATPSRAPVVERAMVAPGTTICALGADSPGKQELDPALLRAARVVCDVRAQALVAGELQHAPDVAAAELGDVLLGRAPGRTTSDDVVVFDATGTALQDAVAAGRLLAAATAVRLLLDAHISGPRIAQALRHRGHDVRAADEERGDAQRCTERALHVTFLPMAATDGHA
jgi:ornithine cyclodeaminase/alanine dehydrogenase-like protein (mu-crystallin family)